MYRGIRCIKNTCVYVPLCLPLFWDNYPNCVPQGAPQGAPQDKHPHEPADKPPNQSIALLVQQKPQVHLYKCVKEGTSRSKSLFCKGLTAEGGCGLQCPLRCPCGTWCDGGTAAV